MYIYNTLSRATTQPLPPPQAVPTRYCQQTALVSPFSVFAHRRSIKSLCKCILENKLLRPPGFAPSVPSLSAIVDSPFPPPFLHTLLLLCSWDDDDDERAATEGILPDCAHPGGRQRRRSTTTRAVTEGTSPQHRSLALAQSPATCTPYDDDEGDTTPLQPPRTATTGGANGSDGDAVAAAPNPARFDDNSAVEYLENTIVSGINPVPRALFRTSADSSNGQTSLNGLVTYEPKPPVFSTVGLLNHIIELIVCEDEAFSLINSITRSQTLLNTQFG
ncbi:hypothetical protein EDB83DRAFT_2519279 [Lactarius deliciosus]|nr:hypothetical protein EDB83DRAFT_2519279 [Lactarius deliciosus]